MNLDTSTFRENEIEVLRTGEIADAGVSNVGRFVSGNNVVPYTHLYLLLLLRTVSLGVDGFTVRNAIGF